jgi:putative inorganic carbon (hco3(-)) transporter
MKQSTRNREGLRPDSILFGGLLLLLLWLPLPRGSHSAWAISVAGAVTFGLLAVWCLLAFGDKAALPRRFGALTVPLLLWLAWLLWIGLQTISLPVELLSSLSPGSAQVHRPVAALNSSTPFYSISIAPGITWSKWMESCLYFGLYLLCILLVRTDRRLRWILIALLVSGLVQASYGSLMLMSGADFGWLYKKKFYLDSATGTFVNQNHFAGYLEIAAAAGIALVLADLGSKGEGWSLRQVVARFLDFLLSAKIRARAALVLIAVGLVLSRSRMGNLAFFTAVSAGGLVYIVLRERRLFLRALILFASVLAVDVLIVAERFGLERVIERIDTTRLEQEGRVKLLAQIPPVVERYAITGSGLGTFSMAYEPYRTESMTEYMNHAHNDYLEFFIETGIVGVLLLGGLLIWHAFHAWRVAFRRNHRLKVAAAFSVLMAMLAVSTHAVAEFLFEIPAIAGSFVVLLGTIAACSDRSRRRRREEAQEDTPFPAPSPETT